MCQRVRHLHMFLRKSAFNAPLNPMKIPHVSAFSLCHLCHGHLLLQGVLFFGGSEANQKEKRQHKSNISENKQEYDGECGFKPR